MALIEEFSKQNLKAYLEGDGLIFKKNMTLCPFHNDRVESMSIDIKDGYWVWYCHKCEMGGNIIHYVMKKHNIPKGEAIKMLAGRFNLETSNEDLNRGRKIVAIYSYYDEEGKILYEIVRTEPKSFFVRRRVNSRWDYTIKGTRRVLFNLPDVLKHDSIWYVEGEKDALALTGLGLTATTHPFGVAHWKSEFAKTLKGKTVFICLDKGYEEVSNKIAVEILKAEGKEVRIIELPGLTKEGEDISDWIKKQGDVEKGLIKQKLVDIVHATAPFEIPDTRLKINNSFLKFFCEWISRSTDAPEIFILFSGVALLSAVLSKFYFYYPLKTHLNLYILLLAPSTFCRKTVCLDIANGYLSDVNEDLCFPESFTPEALFSILQEQSRGIIFWREFIQVKEFLMGKEYSKGISELLTDIYDFKSKWTRRLKTEREPIILKNPILSILAAGVTDWFTNNLKEVDFQGGLWTRFLFIPAPEEERKYHWPTKSVLNPLILKELKQLNALEPIEIDLSKVKPLIIEWGTRHMRHAQKLDSEIYRATFLRLETMLLKLAAILQLSQNKSNVVEPETFKEAVKIIDHLKRELAFFFREEIHFDERSKRKARVLKYIRKKSKIGYKQLLQGTKIPTIQLQPVLRELIADGLVKQTKTPRGGIIIESVEQGGNLEKG